MQQQVGRKPTTDLNTPPAQDGFTLLEMLITFAIAALLIVGLTSLWQNNRQERVTQTVSNQMLRIGDAAQKWADYYTNDWNNAAPLTPWKRVHTLGEISTFLPPDIPSNATTAWRQPLTIYIRPASAVEGSGNVYQALVMANATATPVSEGLLMKTALKMENGGIYARYTGKFESGGQIIYWGNGQSLGGATGTFAESFGLTPAAGQLLYMPSLVGMGLGSGNYNVLHLGHDPCYPDCNTMKTDIMMRDDTHVRHSLTGASEVQAQQMTLIAPSAVNSAIATDNVGNLVIGAGGGSMVLANQSDVNLANDMSNQPSSTLANLVAGSVDVRGLLKLSVVPAHSHCPDIGYVAIRQDNDAANTPLKGTLLTCQDVDGSGKLQWEPASRTLFLNQSNPIELYYGGTSDNYTNFTKEGFPPFHYHNNRDIPVSVHISDGGSFLGNTQKSMVAVFPAYYNYSPIINAPIAISIMATLQLNNPDKISNHTIASVSFIAPPKSYFVYFIGGSTPSVVETY